MTNAVGITRAMLRGTPADGETKWSDKTLEKFGAYFGFDPYWFEFLQGTPEEFARKYNAENNFDPRKLEEAANRTRIITRHGDGADTNHTELEEQRKDFLQRLIGIRLFVGCTGHQDQFPLYITATFCKAVPFRNFVLSLKKTAVKTRFVLCSIVEKTPPEPTRAAEGRLGLPLGEGEVTLMARGDLNAPTWIFQATESQPALDGTYYVHEPPACELQSESDNWDIQAEAVIHPLDIVFESEVDEYPSHNASRIADRVKLLGLFGDDYQLITETVSIRQKS